MADIEQLSTEIADLLHRSEFSSVASLVTELQDDLVRTSDGFNASIQLLDRLSYNSSLIPYLEAWIRSEPETPVPYIISGDIHVQLAWRDRGAGYTYTVLDDGWDGFEAHLKIAGDLYGQALTLKPDDYLLHCELIYFAMCVGDLDLLDSSFTRAIELNPHLPEAYDRKSFALYPRWYGSRAEVESFLKPTLGIGPPFSIVYYDWLYDEYEDGVETPGNMRAKLAEQLAREYLELYPKSALAHRKLAVVLYDHGLKKEAEDLIRKALDLDPASDYHYKLAQYLHFRDAGKEAMAHIKKALEMYPFNQDYWVLKGRILHYEIEDYASAVEAYTQTLERWPNSYTTIRRRGDSYLMNEDFDAAIADFKKALNYNEDYTLAHYGLGKAYLRKGMFSESQAEFAKTLELKPSLKRKIDEYVDYYGSAN